MNWAPVLLVAALTSAPQELERLIEEGRTMEALAGAARQLDAQVAAAGYLDPESQDAFYRYADIARRSGDLTTAWSLAELLLTEQQRQSDADPRRLARAFLLVSKVNRNLDRKRAKKTLQRATDLAESFKTDDPEFWAKTLQQEGNFTRSDDPAAAICFYREALRVRERYSPVPRWSLGQNLVWLGWNLQQRGEIAEAEEQLLRAERVLSEAGLASTFEQAVVESALGAIYLRTGRQAEAQRRFARRAEIMEWLWPHSPAGFSRNRFYDHGPLAIVFSQLQTENWREAWNSATRGEGQVNADFQQLSRWPELDAPGFKQVSKLKSERAQLPHLQDLAAVANWKLVHKALALQSKILLLETRFLEAHPRSAVKVEEIQQELDEDEAYIGWLEFQFGGRHILWGAPDESARSMLGSRWLYVIRKKSIRWLEVERHESYRDLVRMRTRLHVHGNRLQKAASWPSSVGPDSLLEKEALEVGKVLFGRAFDELDGVHHLIVQTSFVNPRIPVESLRLPDGSWLVDRYSTTYALSAQSFLMLRRNSHAKTKIPSILLVGNAFPSSSADSNRYARLPHVNDEIKGIAEEFTDARVVQISEVSKAQARELVTATKLPDFDIIHLAGHFSTHPFIDRNGIVLSGGGTSASEDRRIEVHEILDQWRLKTDLVTLSGCKTIDSRGYSSTTLPIVQALMAAGARNVVGSVFDVDDEAMKRLMIRFYANLAGNNNEGPGTEPREALREARVWLRDYRDEAGQQPYRHPSYWTGVGLIGGGN